MIDEIFIIVPLFFFKSRSSRFVCNGISGAEREIYEKENDGTAGDPYRDSGIFPLRDRYREEEKRCYYP